jgi:ribulose-phosphate 3-epimerase
MINNPLRYIEDFINAGSDMLTLHIETAPVSSFKRLKPKLSRKNIKLGVSLNPDTSLKRIEPVLDIVDLVLVMTVNPGFGGQKFIPEVLPKIERLRKIYRGIISVDGGINDKNAFSLIKAGVDILASGSYLFGAKNIQRAINLLRFAYRKE